MIEVLIAGEALIDRMGGIGGGGLGVSKQSVNKPSTINKIWFLDTVLIGSIAQTEQLNQATYYSRL